MVPFSLCFPCRHKLCVSQAMISSSFWGNLPSINVLWLIKFLISIWKHATRHCRHHCQVLEQLWKIAIQGVICLLGCHWRTMRLHWWLTWQCEWDQQMMETQYILGSIRSFPFVVECVSFGAGSGWSSEVLVVLVQGRYHSLWLDQYHCHHFVMSEVALSCS